jgi:hypothetical protein
MMVVLVVLAAIGALSMVQWVVGALFGFVRLALLIPLVLAVLWLVFRGVGKDD